MNWITDLTIDDIPSEQMRSVAERCGISDAITLMVKLPGIELYIPSAGKKLMDRQVIARFFNGENASTLAVRLGMDRKKVIELSRRDLEENPDFMVNKPMQIVARECGDAIAIRLMQKFPSLTIYIPKDGFSAVRRRYIEKSFTGSNTQELALSCQVTERHVRKVISDYYDSKTSQTSVFSA